MVRKAAGKYSKTKKEQLLLLSFTPRMTIEFLPSQDNIHQGYAQAPGNVGVLN